ncbi:MAG: hypothetical protein ACI31G_01450 [Bacilli bacterium]
MTTFKLLSLLTISLTSFATSSVKSAVVNTLDPTWYAGGRWVSVDTSFTTEGIVSVASGYDSVGGSAWQQKVSIPSKNSSTPSFVTESFSIEGDNEVLLELSIPMFNSDGSTNFTSNNSGDYVYVDVINDDLDQCILRFKTAMSSNGVLSNAHSYQVATGNDWPSPSTEGINKIKGNATSDSSFFVGVSRQYGLRSYIDGSNNLERLDDSNGTISSYIENNLSSVTHIRFDIYGDNGWTKDGTIIIKSINGQSFLNGPDINDDTAPKLVKTSSLPTNLVINEPYTLPLKSVDPVSNSSISVTSDDGTIDGLTFTPTKSGEVNVNVLVSDDYSNSKSETLTFTVLSAINPPSFISVPTITGGLIEPLTTLFFDYPTYVDETGIATVELLMNKVGDSNKTSLNKTGSNQFYLNITNQFESGSYEFVYVVTNSAGSVSSEPQIVEYTLNIKPSPDFVSYDDGMIVDYVDEGIRIKSDGGYRNASFKHYNLSYGVDITYTVPVYISENVENEVSYVDLKLINETNPNYSLWYRIWINGFVNNDSSPTNVYVFMPNQSTVDITDCGWLSRNVNDVDGCFRMAFDFDNYFQGEFKEELKAANYVEETLNTFFQSAPSSLYTIAISPAGSGASSGEKLEVIVNTLNKQSFVNEDGVLTKIRKPTLEVELSSYVFASNTNVEIPLYAKNILAEQTVVKAKIYNGTETIFETSTTSQILTINVNQYGLFTLDIYIEYGENKSVTESFDIEIRSVIESVSITLDAEYESSYLPGDSITILPATYSSNVNLENSTITMIYPDGDEEEVSPNQVVELERPGIYELVYFASDNALPNPNTTTLRKFIKVLDVIDPIIYVDIVGEKVVNEVITIRVMVTEDSSYDTYIFLTDLEGNREIYEGDSVTFTPTKVGDYEVKVHVEDMYGNVSEATQIIQIVKPTMSKTLIQWIIIGSLIAVMLIGFVVFSIVYRYKNGGK